MHKCSDRQTDKVVYLLLLVEATERRARLEAALERDSDLVVLGSGPDLNRAYPLAATAPEPQVIIVDSANGNIARPEFWVALHVTYPTARFVAIAENTTPSTAYIAALQAGTYCFALWTDDASRWREATRAAHAGQRFYSSPRLLAHVQCLIRDLDTAILQIGDLRIVPETHRVTLRGRTLKLTEQEFGMLVYLAQRAGQVVTPNDLLWRIWQCDLKTGGTKNQVDCCFKRLREKLTARSDDPAYLRTRRGHGYEMLTDAEWRARYGFPVSKES